MAETLADLEAQLADIRAQKALPKVSTFGQHSTTARDLEELDAIEAQLLARIATLTPPATPEPRMFYAYANGKGT